METPNLGVPIASGRTADIYPWGEGTVLKLYHPWVPLTDVEAERRKTLVARAAGVAAPEVGEIVRQEGRLGLIFERVDGPTLYERVMTESQSMESLARSLADQHRKVHGVRVGNRLPTLRKRLIEKVSRCRLLSTHERASVLDRIERLPDGDRLCHGDFHPRNVMMPAGVPIIIDWVDAGSGSPAADVARTSMLLLGHAENNVTDEVVKRAVLAFHQTYLKHYFTTMPELQSAYEQWLGVIAAAQLSEEIEEQEEWLLARVREALSH